MLRPNQLTDELVHGYTVFMRYELVELDPATGEEDQLLGTGTWKAMERHRDEILEELEEDWDSSRAGWPVLVIQPQQ
jgi:hypothetical protein